MKQLSLLTFSTILLVGCTAPQVNYTPLSQKISKPPIGSVNTAYVGDKLLEQGVMVNQDALNVPLLTKVSLYKLSVGYYVKTGQDSKGYYYKAENHINNGGKVEKNVLADPYSAVMLTSDGKLCVITTLNLKTCITDHQAKSSSILIQSNESFQQTLIYSGKMGQKINVGYREFSGNLARPAFNNDVEYDLSESKQIGYKGALLEIIDATNQNITYKVLRNFSENQ